MREINRRKLEEIESRDAQVKSEIRLKAWLRQQHIEEHGEMWEHDSPTYLEQIKEMRQS